MSLSSGVFSAHSSSLPVWIWLLATGCCHPLSRCNSLKGCNLHLVLILLYLLLDSISYFLDPEPKPSGSLQSFSCWISSHSAYPDFSSLFTSVSAHRRPTWWTGGRGSKPTWTISGLLDSSHLLPLPCSCRRTPFALVFLTIVFVLLHPATHPQPNHWTCCSWGCCALDICPYTYTVHQNFLESIGSLSALKTTGNLSEKTPLRPLCHLLCSFPFCVLTQKIPTRSVNESQVVDPCIMEHIDGNALHHAHLCRIIRNDWKGLDFGHFVFLAYPQGSCPHCLGR